MTRRRTDRPAPLEAQDFLRSINLCFDAQQPDRIAHFRPTAKSLPLIKGIMGDTQERAFLVVAPYGSGKSLTLTYLLNLVENRPEAQDMLASIEARVGVIDPELRKRLLGRRRTKKRGLTLALHGFQSNLPQAIQNAALEAINRNKLGRRAKVLGAAEVSSIEDAIKLLQDVKKMAERARLDRLCILWDETGRHLEALVSGGRTAELSDIQVLAEYASRSSDLPVTFAVTLHQSMLHYAQQMTQSVRAEWQKISGRFETIQYVDDSKEIYRLVADITASNRGQVKSPTKKRLRSVAKSAKEKHGLFTDFTLSELVDLFDSTYPTNPAALFLLPRVSARVAQNERTLFTFLYSAALADGFSIADLYDYFSPAMRGDTAVGGTHKQWLETESAISKTSGDEADIEVLKSACLLSMGTKGERSRLGRDSLVWALQGYDKNPKWREAVSRLIKNKLLLYRKHSEDVSVWHGTDVDLRGRLAEEKAKHRATFDLLGFLNTEAQPDAWKPIEYNTQYGVTRYWRGRYLLAKDFIGLLEQPEQLGVPVGRDGEVLYLVTESAEDLCDAQNIAQNIDHPQLLVVVPNSALSLMEAALEAWCLSNMQHNTELTGEDPLVLPEIQQMVDDSRGHLHTVLDRLVKPGSDGPRWYHQGQVLPVASIGDLRHELSRITEQVFPDTPRIHNELINRHHPSGTIVNSRKKLLMGILERHGTPDLSLIPTTPDASMFRTILLHTGLYHQMPEGNWGYSSGKTSSLAEDTGLKKVWNMLRQFFEVPEDTPKRPSLLFDELLRPPYGIRRGLLPILFAAALKAFGKAISLRRNGEYIKDVLPTVIEDLCRNSEDYELAVIELDSHTEAYLAAMRDVFLGHQRVDADTDAIRATYDAIQSWLFQLPRAALTAEGLSPAATQFQKLLERMREADPLTFLMRRLPEVCGFDYRENGRVREVLEPLKNALESISHTFVRKASAAIHQALSRAQSESGKGIQKLARQWASYFPDSVTATGLPGIARSLLNRMKMDYDDEALFVNSLALLLVGRTTEDWEDSTAIEFENKIYELTHKIETTALRTSTIVDLGEAQEIREGLSHLVVERIEDLYEQLARLLGEERAEKVMKNILKGNANGHVK